MKKIPIIILCVSVAALITCVALAVAYRPLPDNTDASQTPSDTISIPSYTVPDISVDVVTDTPVPTPTYNLPMGTYYLVASTNASPLLRRHELENTCQYECVQLTFHPSGTLNIQYRGNVLAEWTEEGDNIVFDAEEFLNRYPFDAEHSDEWLQKYEPDNIEGFTCTYDKEKNLLTMRHGVDSMEFMHFDTLEDAVAWYSQYIPKGGELRMPYFFSQYEDITLPPELPDK